MTSLKKELKDVRFDLLQQVVDHLRFGKLGHKIFDFTLFNFNEDFVEEMKCGTAGCAKRSIWWLSMKRRI